MRVIPPENDILGFGTRLLFDRLLKFHNDWNHLHLVIDKINEYRQLDGIIIPPNVQGLISKVINGSLTTRIEYVYEDVINVIQAIQTKN